MGFIGTINLKFSLWVGKNGFDRVEIRHAVNRVRLQIAAFRPFVPAIQVEDAQAVGLGEQTLPGQFQGGAEILRQYLK